MPFGLIESPRRSRSRRPATAAPTARGGPRCPGRSTSRGRAGWLRRARGRAAGRRSTRCAPCTSGAATTTSAPAAGRRARARSPTPTSAACQPGSASQAAKVVGLPGAPSANAPTTNSAAVTQPESKSPPTPSAEARSPAGPPPTAPRSRGPRGRAGTAATSSRTALPRPPAGSPPARARPQGARRGLAAFLIRSSSAVSALVSCHSTAATTSPPTAHAQHDEVDGRRPAVGRGERRHEGERSADPRQRARDERRVDHPAGRGGEQQPAEARPAVRQVPRVPPDPRGLRCRRPRTGRDPARGPADAGAPARRRRRTRPPRPWRGTARATATTPCPRAPAARPTRTPPTGSRRRTARSRTRRRGTRHPANGTTRPPRRASARPPRRRARRGGRAAAATTAAGTARCRRAGPTTRRRGQPRATAIWPSTPRGPAAAGAAEPQQGVLGEVRDGGRDRQDGAEAADERPRPRPGQTPGAPHHRQGHERGVGRDEEDVEQQEPGQSLGRDAHVDLRRRQERQVGETR